MLRDKVFGLDFPALSNRGSARSSGEMSSQKCPALSASDEKLYKSQSCISRCIQVEKTKYFFLG
jgi:hypothetical protein